jgi:hypothetical protein
MHLGRLICGEPIWEKNLLAPDVFLKASYLIKVAEKCVYNRFLVTDLRIIGTHFIEQSPLPTPHVSSTAD